jgi:hypothetical protein
MSGDAQRRLILHMAVSLDGFVARSDGVIDWLSTPRPGGVDPGDHRHHANLEMLGQIGLVVLGRRAYEEMAPAWSSSDSPTARILNALPKIVFAREHSPIVVGIRRAQHRANPRAKRGLIGLGLTHEVAQRALPNHGVQGAAHGLVGVLNGRLREREENPFLAAHPLEIGDQLALQSTIAHAHIGVVDQRIRKRHAGGASPPPDSQVPQSPAQINQTSRWDLQSEAR